jgi:hypothetical protein
VTPEIDAGTAGHPQCLINIRFEVEHIRPVARGGKSDRENLWLSCRTCNAHKADRLSGVDPQSRRCVRLFNPRRQSWNRHFRWSGIHIEGVTPTGRATVATLHLNDPAHLVPRQIWLTVELFPFPE